MILRNILNLVNKNTKIHLVVNDKNMGTYSSPESLKEETLFNTYRVSGISSQSDTTIIIFVESK